MMAHRVADLCEIAHQSIQILVGLEENMPNIIA
jgi:hypothetical protein